jgi:hypothetical protein
MDNGIKLEEHYNAKRIIAYLSVGGARRVMRWWREAKHVSPTSVQNPGQRQRKIWGGFASPKQHSGDAELDVRHAQCVPSTGRGGDVARMGAWNADGAGKGKGMEDAGTEGRPIVGRRDAS